jgi:L-asparaginase
MRGNRTMKISAEVFDAFSSPNYPPLAEAGLHIKYNAGSIKYPGIKRYLTVHKNLDSNVAILKLFPGITRNLVHAVLNTEGLKAVIIETFGSGNAPTHKWFIDELAVFIGKGGIILNVTQCHGGSVEMGLYETSREMVNAGVVGGKDITTEASVTKLMYLLGRYCSREDIISNLTKSISGEMS